MRVRRRIAETVRSLDRLELDDVGTESAEVAGEISTRPKRAQVKDFQSGEWQGRILCRNGPWSSWRRLTVRGDRGGFREPERRARLPKRPALRTGVDEEVPLDVLGTLECAGTVGDRRRRNPQCLAQFDDFGDGSIAQPRLGGGEEFGTLGAAHHDRELLLAEFRQSEHV